MRFAVQQAVTHIRLPADFEHTEANMDTLCKALTLHCQTVAPTATVRSVASAASAVAVLMWPTDVPWPCLWVALLTSPRSVASRLTLVRPHMTVWTWRASTRTTKERTSYAPLSLEAIRSSTRWNVRTCTPVPRALSAIVLPCWWTSKPDKTVLERRSEERATMSPQTNNTQHLLDAPQSSSTACRSCVRTPRLLNPQHPWHRAAQVVRKVQNSTTFVRAGPAIRPSALADAARTCRGA